MNIAIIGYGKMGKEIEKIAKERNHNINLIIDVNNISDLNSENFKNIDVAIEFSTPETATDNIYKCLENDIPVVSGTTGWLDNYNDVVNYCKQNNKTFFYASNYSIGVNILFEINQHLAKIMNNFNNYEVLIEETHHIYKLDKPSGTAISLANQILENNKIKKGWELETKNKEFLNIKSYREGEVPGIHKITYKSDIDKLELSHSAFSRKGFALGAVLAAEFIKDKTGIFNMKDLLQF